MAEGRVMVAKASRAPGFYMPGTRPVWWKNTHLWQARLWIGHAHGGAISLGLHHSMQAANRFFLRVRERFDDAAKTNPDPLALIAWQCALDLWDTRVRTCGLMPKWVRVVPGTVSFAVFQSRRGRPHDGARVPDAAGRIRVVLAGGPAAPARRGYRCAALAKVIRADTAIRSPDAAGDVKTPPRGGWKLPAGNAATSAVPSRPTPRPARRDYHLPSRMKKSRTAAGQCDQTVSACFFFFRSWMKRAIWMSAPMIAEISMIPNSVG